MTIKLGVVMDPINTINYKKDSTLAMLWEAEARGWEIFYFEEKDLFLRNSKACGLAKGLKVYKDPQKWYEFQFEKEISLASLNIILMRKDPPVNDNYVYTTYILEAAEREGVLVANKPQGLRDANEKIFAMRFSEYCPNTLVASSIARLKEFLHEHQDIVCKPLNAMGGVSIYRLRDKDINTNVIFETLTNYNKVPIMVQKYIPEITHGDKRVVIVDGKPIAHVLSRIPAANDWRGNLAQGARGIVQPISENDAKIANVVGPVLKKMGVFFAGLDIIGNYLTEINVTSPTCIREIDTDAHLNIAGQLLNSLQSHIS